MRQAYTFKFKPQIFLQELTVFRESSREYRIRRKLAKKREENTENRFFAANKVYNDDSAYCL